MRIFVWPKVIFLYPTAIVALICWAGMWMNHDRTHDPTRPLKDAMKNIAEEDKTVGGQPATRRARSVTSRRRTKKSPLLDCPAD